MTFTWGVMLALHQLCAVVWVGGMFLLLVCLRPSMGTVPQENRIALMYAVLSRFLPIAVVCAAGLLFSGFAMLLTVYGGFAGAGWHIHVMLVTGLLMMAVLAHLWFAPYRRLRRACAADDVPEAARNLEKMRLFVTINLLLGLLTTAIGAGGRVI